MKCSSETQWRSWPDKTGVGCFVFLGGKDVLQAPALELKILFPADKDNVFTAKEVM